MHFSKEQLRQARTADLYSYLLRTCPDQVLRYGDSLKLRSDHSVSIHRGFPGYHDFADDSSGNSVDFLVRFMDYSVPEAVLALCDEDAAVPVTNRPQQARSASTRSTKISIFPPRTSGRYNRVHAYLTSRGISSETLSMLYRSGLLYQDAEHGNAVFLNQEKTCAEIRGTLSDRKYHRVVQPGKDRGWYFASHPQADTIYLCESAIDAISLYEIHRHSGNAAPAYYFSLIGVGNQTTIDRIKQLPHKLPQIKHVILAVDNDAAGSRCREKNPDLPYIIPTGKDWNEDLQVLLSQSRK